MGEVPVGDTVPHGPYRLRLAVGTFWPSRVAAWKRGIDIQVLPQQIAAAATVGTGLTPR
jgi:hypothetical protein